MNFILKQSESSSIENLYQDLNNPGKGGDSSLYAFALGLISVIQTEIYKGNDKPLQLENLNKLSTTIKKYEPQQFIDFDYSRRNIENKELLETLKSDLRCILHSQYLQEIYRGSVIIEGRNRIRESVTFKQFAEIFYYYHHGASLDKNSNILYSSEQIRHYIQTCAQKYNRVKEPSKLEYNVEEVFLSDLFGKDYLSTIQVPWQQSYKPPNIYLSDEESYLIQLFKQFKATIINLYHKSFTGFSLTPDFKNEYEKESIICANSIRKKINSLFEQIKIIVGTSPLDQSNLDEGILYVQLIDNKTVRAYSSSLENFDEYTPENSEKLINIIRRKCPFFKFEYGFELSVNNNEPLFQDLLSAADEIINSNFLFRLIKQNFLDIYSQKKFKKPIDQLELVQKTEIARINRLIDLENTNPFSEQGKQDLIDSKLITVRSAIKRSSLIYQALSKIMEHPDWLSSYQDFDYLNEFFKINLVILENGEYSPRPEGTNFPKRPTIAIDNLNNNRWTTRLRYGYFAGESSEKYARWVCKGLPFSKTEIKNLLLTYTTGFVSFFGRTHELKAKELIRRCDDPNSNVTDLIHDLREYMANVEYKPNSSFLKRFEYLDARYRNFEEDLFNKKDIEKIFRDYVATGFLRNHLPMAQRILVDCKKTDTTIDDIIISINTYVNAHSFNDNSHFLERVNKVNQLKKLYDEQMQNYVDDLNVVI